MTPAEGRRRMDPAERRGLGQAFALDHRPSVIKPFFLLAQMRHWRLGQRIEGAPAALAAKPQKPMRAAPADNLAARAMGTARAATRSTLVVPSASSWRLRLPPFFAEAPASPQPRSPSQAPPSPPSVGPRSSPKSPTAKPQNPQPSSNRSLDPSHLKPNQQLAL